jgi:hypothetical protein
MRRSIAILGWMMLGAFASSAGFGFVLYASNQDRARLIQEAATATQEANQLRAANDALVAEANQKLQQAEAQVAEALKIVKRYEEEKALLEQTEPLIKPSARELRGWKEALSYGLGISVSVPPQSTAEESLDTLVALGPASLGRATREQWMSIAKYNAETEKSLLANLQNASEQRYAVDNRVLVGVKGRLGDLPGDVYFFRVVQSGVPTHLIWARANGVVTDRQVLNALSTLTFKS